MNKFSSKFSEQIEGAISGFDRLVFRGTLRAIAYELGMKTYLWHSRILLKDFGRHVEQTSQALKGPRKKQRDKPVDRCSFCAPAR